MIEAAIEVYVVGVVVVVVVAAVAARTRGGPETHTTKGQHGGRVSGMRKTNFPNECRNHNRMQNNTQKQNDQRLASERQREKGYEVEEKERKRVDRA